MKRSVVITLLVIVFCVAAFADLLPVDPPKTKPAKSIDANLLIKLDKNAKYARLIVPRNALKELRAQIADLDQNDNDTATAEASVITRTRTIVSGLLLSLAMVFGGVWFTRSGKIAPKTAAVVVLVLASGAVATLVFANAGPPPEARSITGKLFAAPVHALNVASGPIKIETTKEPGGVVLIVPDPQGAPQPGDE